jgi:DNA-binding NarL/FixJ family response regulator
MRIVIVEDDALQLSIITEWVSELFGCEITSYTNGPSFREGEFGGDKAAPEVILMDFYLGNGAGETGAELVNVIRSAQGPIASAGIIMTSGVSAKSLARATQDLAIDGFLLKDQISRESLGIAIRIAQRLNSERRVYA